MRYCALPLLLLLAAGCDDAATHAAAGREALPAKDLRVVLAKSGFPGADPTSSAWDGAREVVVPLLPQDVAEPRLLEKGVDALRLRALHDGEKVAFRLEWEDPSADALVALDRASDACAIELPANGPGGPLPDSMMGEKGKPVFIALWRFGSQERVAGKPFGVDALHPNRVTDHYPPDAARDAAAKAEMEKRYAHATAAENPVVASRMTSPVEDLIAEGFGSLRTAAEQRSTGNGVHADGRWRVAITRPLDVAPGAATALRPGTSTFIACAVWQGSKAQLGAKKMRSIWVPLEVEGPKP